MSAPPDTLFSVAESICYRPTPERNLNPPDYGEPTDQELRSQREEISRQIAGESKADFAEFILDRLTAKVLHGWFAEWETPDIVDDISPALLDEWRTTYALQDTDDLGQRVATFVEERLVENWRKQDTAELGEQVARFFKSVYDRRCREAWAKAGCE